MGHNAATIIGQHKDTLKVTLFIPCFNEQDTVAKCLDSCLAQEHKLHQIIVVDDSSTDRTPKVLARYADRVTVVKTPKNTGNKSHAQEYGFQFITGDLVISTDADTILHPKFVSEMVKVFVDPKVVAAGGYIRSMKYNWITRCRAVDYVIGQNIHKLAQSHMGYMFVIPGAAAAFRTRVFKSYLTFDHDTITEDLDFTYKLHKHGLQVAYCRKAVVFTQDPTTLHSYINQMRRWFGGGWQNLLKHLDVETMHPVQTLELSLTYIEGLVFSILLLLIPLINLRMTLYFWVSYLFIAFLFSAYAAFMERRKDLLLAPVPYMFLMYVNAYIFVEQFIKEFVLRKNNLIWFKPERVQI